MRKNHRRCLSEIGTTVAELSEVGSSDLLSQI